MAGRQVAFILAALVVVGLAGLGLRLASGGSAPTTLSGLFPLTDEVVDQMVILSGDSEVRLFKVGGEWRAGSHPEYSVRVINLWAAIDLLPSAQAVAERPTSHERLGVDRNAGVTVTFYRNGSVLDSVLIGKWSEDAQLGYLRHPPGDTVYGLPFDIAFIFDPDPDAWRDPDIVNVPAAQVASVAVAGPEGTYALAQTGLGWTLTDDNGALPANPMGVDSVLRLLAPLVASGFATAEEAAGLDISDPYGSVSVTLLGGGDGQRVAFARRDAGSYYAVAGGESTVFIVDADVVDAVLLPASQLTQ